MYIQKRIQTVDFTYKHTLSIHMKPVSLRPFFADSLLCTLQMLAGVAAFDDAGDPSAFNVVLLCFAHIYTM